MNDDEENQSNTDPRRNKRLLYLAFGLTGLGGVLALISTIFILIPSVELTWSNLFRIPWTYILLSGLIILTAGFILHRRITPPMKREEEILRSRLE
ncbi:MAG: hypothetical protein GF308_00410 [Candidatus Heimdallarchaeota archaeon]|nr:hypothetical protein [Candidatus Heimdallarchaeota archaeon]